MQPQVVPPDASEPVVEPSRGERRRERTRRRLLEAGRTLIAERGVAGLRIQEITERADVALGSFYNHFPGKDELVEEVVRESLSDLASAFVSDAAFADTQDPAVAVAAANLRFIRLARVEPDFARLVVNLSHADVLFGAAVHPHARRALERGIDRGRFVVTDLEVTLTSVIGGALALIREVLDGRHGPDADTAFAAHVLASLCVPVHEIDAIVRRASATIRGIGDVPE